MHTHAHIHKHVLTYFPQRQKVKRNLREKFNGISCTAPLLRVLQLSWENMVWLKDLGQKKKRESCAYGTESKPVCQLQLADMF